MYDFLLVTNSNFGRRVLGLPDGEEIMPLAFFVLTIPARDRQTDGHVAITITRASIASCG